MVEATTFFIWHAMRDKAVTHCINMGYDDSAITFVVDNRTKVVEKRTTVADRMNDLLQNDRIVVRSTTNHYSFLSIPILQEPKQDV